MDVFVAVVVNALGNRQRVVGVYTQQQAALDAVCKYLQAEYPDKEPVIINKTQVIVKGVAQGNMVQGYVQHFEVDSSEGLDLWIEDLRDYMELMRHFR
jgi:hypothetical protein